MAFKEVTRTFGFSIWITGRYVRLYCSDELESYNTADIFYDKSGNQLGIKPYKSKAGKFKVCVEKKRAFSTINISSLFRKFKLPYPEKAIKLEHEEVDREDGIKYIIELPKED